MFKVFRNKTCFKEVNKVKPDNKWMLRAKSEGKRLIECLVVKKHKRIQAGLFKDI